MRTETTAIQRSPTRAPSRGMRKCNNVRRATKKPAQANQVGRTPVLRASREVAVTSTEVPTWQKWYSHEASASVIKTS